MTTSMPATSSTSSDDELSTLIRTATLPAHQAAEHAPFVQDLLGGRLPLAEYARLVAQHHVLYSTLEPLVAANADADVAPFLAPELARLPAIAADLEHLIGVDWATDLLVLPATRAYCDHLQSIADAWPGGVLAHHYVRYLGDLSGGQIIGRVLQRVYDLTGDEGTRFYRFPDIESPKAFKSRYRARLDALPWDAEARGRLIDEVKVAYQLNADVFFELAPPPVLASSHDDSARAAVEERYSTFEHGD